ncbi:hypothetical protein KUTeg_020166 [Tegillarca granosa]|uniref:C1q domain-containing protein n=1 Tax=Tegillarca granosa TaxID=220873 RepID=A0ABQ9E753_TEGGR|nr:hypothetical protein KUTeg_020166 [Tegillarca granosa]
MTNQSVTTEYNHVITNLEPRTGHFTCPVKGLYLFAVTTMSSSTGSNNLFTVVVKDGAQVTRMYSTSTSSSSTTYVFLITLDVGDMILVRTTFHSSQIIHGVFMPHFWVLLFSKLCLVTFFRLLTLINGYVHKLGQVFNLSAKIVLLQNI